MYDVTPIFIYAHATRVRSSSWEVALERTDHPQYNVGHLVKWMVPRGYFKLDVPPIYVLCFRQRSGERMDPLSKVSYMVGLGVEAKEDIEKLLSLFDVPTRHREELRNYNVLDGSTVYCHDLKQKKLNKLTGQDVKTKVLKGKPEKTDKLEQKLEQRIYGNLKWELGKLEWDLRQKLEQWKNELRDNIKTNKVEIQRLDSNLTDCMTLLAKRNQRIDLLEAMTNPENETEDTTPSETKPFSSRWLRSSELSESS